MFSEMVHVSAQIQVHFPQKLQFSTRNIQQIQNITS